MVPANSWLNRNGFNALVQMRGKHPDLFSHLEWKSDRDYLTLGKARQICRSYGIESSADYKVWKGRPQHLPFDPSSVYKITWNEFFKKPRKAGVQEARKLCRRSGVASGPAYCRWRNRPKCLPGSPVLYYGMSWNEFFKKPRKVGVQEARKLCRRYEVDSVPSYRGWRNRPKSLPANPSKFYGMTWNEFFQRRPRLSR